VYHITQEAVNNALRHGKAKQVTIAVSRTGEGVVITVTDDGIGIPEEPRTDGMGLRIMDFRANMIGGRLSVHAAETGGTVVRLVFDDTEKKG
jgi:signal transduction histidine kinase